MTQFNVPLNNLPTRKVKGVLKTFGGLILPFYFIATAVNEAAPVKVKSNSTGDKSVNASVEVVPCVVGASDGAKAIGLTAQITYSDALTGQMQQLQGYHFVNDTAQRLNGQPIGILGGAGHAVIRNYTGIPTAEGQCYVGPSGTIAVTGDTGDKLPAIFETTATANGDPVRIRFHFPLGVLG